jgi:hypothetical protein
MEFTPLSPKALLDHLHSSISQLTDSRRKSNATKYTMRDAILGAFSMFFMQNESFLEHQRQMTSLHGKSNAQTMFGIFNIPTNQQIKNILDGIPATALIGVFDWVYRVMRDQGLLQSFEYLGGLMVALDGTQYYSSQKIKCKCCSSRQHANGKVTYYHSAILPVIVAPGQSQVISLAPELITPQDGHEKQDCEVEAAKRWVEKHASKMKGHHITLLGDDIYSRQPMCESIAAAEMNFVFTCLPESHVYLYESLEVLDKLGSIKELEVKKGSTSRQETLTYRYVNDIPINGSKKSFNINWCEVKVTRDSDGKILYNNAFATKHELDEETVVQVVEAGRSRWKTENENHNILKTKGYHLEHNFGHGQEHLASTLLILNLMAFLFHTILHLVDEKYQKARKKRGTRKGFFQDITSLTKYLLFESWQALLDFMLYGSPPLLRSHSP